MYITIAQPLVKGLEVPPRVVYQGKVFLTNLKIVLDTTILSLLYS